jgi:hypothetical protein
MYFVKTPRLMLLFLGCLLLASCGDNLLPSGEDQRPAVQAGSTGGGVGQQAPVFSVADTGNNVVTLQSALTGKKGVVLYFTMWCPICDIHMSGIRPLIATTPAVGFYLVDYVSGSVAAAGSAESGAGYAGSGFVTLADVDHVLSNDFQGTMGTTVVIDSSGTVRMNEDYKDGVKLQAVLSGLP